MSKLETPMTEAFWLSQAPGAFIPEYPLVLKASDRQRRCVDGLILPQEENRRASWREFPSLTGRAVVVVQTKVGAMGMYLMGQAVFSARLALAAGASSARSILLCERPDAALLPLLADFPEVEVWTVARNGGCCLRVN